MLTFASNDNRHRVAIRQLLLGTVCRGNSCQRRSRVCTGAWENSRAGIDQFRMAWRRRMARSAGGDARADQERSGSPLRGNNDGLGQPTVRIANWRDPVLKPWRRRK